MSSHPFIDRWQDSGAAERANLVARNFVRARVPEVAAILDTLVALGQIKKNENAYSV